MGSGFHALPSLLHGCPVHKRSCCLASAKCLARTPGIEQADLIGVSQKERAGSTYICKRKGMKEPLLGKAGLASGFGLGLAKDFETRYLLAVRVGLERVQLLSGQ